jgi:2-keto-4-pentenoate hydratase/2-oxohepta-3-ene-1,7-dioic acid hydratase in catechol pathway
MKYCRFLFGGQSIYGTIDMNRGELKVMRQMDTPQEDLRSQLEHAGMASWFLSFAPTPFDQVELLPPVTPGKIVCVGRNYREHASELGNEVPTEPLIFLKPPSSILRPGGAIQLPSISERVDYEGELALVIGKRTRNFKPDHEWREVVRGFTLANDVTARDLQKKDPQWTRAKGFDTFCPVGPLVSDELDLDAGIIIETRLNGELRQRASTRDLIFSVPVLLAYISAAITLEVGDLILTGTPSGVGPLAHGDRVEVTANGLGVLSNTVEGESSTSLPPN